LTDYRIGFILDDPVCRVSSDVADVLKQAIDALRKAGVTLEEGWPTGVVPTEQYDTYLYLLYATYGFLLRDEQIDEMRALAAKRDGSYRSKLAEAWTAPVKSLGAATSRRMAARAVWQEYFRTHDAFLLPTAFVAAFPHDHSNPLDARRLLTPTGQREYNDLLFWISFATLTGLPATTAPIGVTRAGLPVGLQIIGPYLEDATPIDIAGKLADVTGGFTPPKGY
jgi:amidase